MYPILAGMKIIELTAFVAAPLAGLTLHQLGAEIIKIDPEGGGLDHQRWPLSKEGTSLYWTGLNKGKKSVTLNLRSEAGKMQFTEILRHSGEDGGIILTNLAGPEWLSYEVLRKIRPDLIMVSLIGHYDGKTAVDYTVNCAVGMPLITGIPETLKFPINSVMPTWDAVAGLTLATGLLAAERHRRITGEGQFVNLALSDTAYAMVANLGYMAEAQTSSNHRPAIGNHIYGTFGHDLQTRDDRRVMVVALTKRQWQSLLQATNMQDEMAKITEKSGLDLTLEGNRYQMRDEILVPLQQWAQQKELAEIANIFDTENICWGLYQSFQQMAHEDQRASLKNPLFQEIEQEGVGRIKAAGSPLIFSAFKRDKLRSASRIGADTETVLADIAKKSGNNHGGA